MRSVATNKMNEFGARCGKTTDRLLLDARSAGAWKPGQSSAGGVYPVCDLLHPYSLIHSITAFILHHLTCAKSILLWVL